MTEVFVIDGESLESVQQAIHDCKVKVLGENPGSSVSKVNHKDKSLKDVEVEVISYKTTLDGELSAPAEVKIIRSKVKLVKQNHSSACGEK